MENVKRKFYDTPFRGKIKSLRLISTQRDTSEMLHHIDIRKNGMAWFSGLDIKHRPIRSQSGNVSKAEAKRLIEEVADYFSKKNRKILSDVSFIPCIWKLELINTRGETYRYMGEVAADFMYRKMKLSVLSAKMRNFFGIDDLCAFDGNQRLRDVRKITVERKRPGWTKVTIPEDGRKPFGNSESWAEWEKLVLDLDRETIQMSRHSHSLGRLTKKYKLGVAGEYLAGDFYARFSTPDLFLQSKDKTKDEAKTAKRKRSLHYKIKIDYRKGPSRVIKGRFDKEGLPKDFWIFVELVQEKLHGFPEANALFGSDFCKRSRSGEGEYIFCSVIFEEGGQKYYYLTEDKTIEEGDVVFVPVGPENHVIPGVVTDIEYFTGEDAPYPLEKVKNIIRKATEAEMKIDMDEIDAYLNPEDGDISIGQKLLMKRREKRGVRRTFFTQ